MHSPKSVLENETHKIFWDFEIPKEYRIPARGPDLELIIKKKLGAVWILPFQGTTEKNKRMRKEKQVLGPYHRTKKRYAT